MKKIILVSIFLLFAIGIAGYSYFTTNHLCGAIFTWGENEKTGRCRYFLSDCLDKGYKPIDPKKCDCENIENFLQPKAKEDCQAQKTINLK